MSFGINNDDTYTNGSYQGLEIFFALGKRFLKPNPFGDIKNNTPEPGNLPRFVNDRG